MALVCVAMGFKASAVEYPHTVQLTPLICGVDVTPTANPRYQGAAQFNSITVKVVNSKNEIVAEATVPQDETTLIKGLRPDTKYGVDFVWGEGESAITSHGYFTTNKGVLEYGNFNQDFYFEFTVTAMPMTDKSIPNPKQYGVLDGKRYEPDGHKFTFENLHPGTRYYPVIHTDYNGYDCVYGPHITTRSIRYDFKKKDVGPTSVLIERIPTKYARVVDTWWEAGSEKFTGETFMATGLVPESKYTIYLYAQLDDGYKFVANTIEGTLPSLELELLEPQVPASLTALIAAKTNISEVETSVGFQWKKYDAPATLSPKSANAPIVDGIMEGRISNLSPADYYSVRAFYKDVNGEYYCTEWKSFDPYDFSFFEPTVRTYAVQEVTENSATVRGYALAGTDNIKSQGFQYWKVQGVKRMFGASPSDNQIVTVPAQGQVMSVTFENLEAGTEYVYRAYVETETGYTYGEEQGFTTQGSAGISAVESEVEAAVVVGYCNLMGLRSDEPFEGVNIVLYSDGSSRKMMMRK